MEAGRARQQTSTQTLTPNATHKNRKNRDIEAFPLSLYPPQVLCCPNVDLPFHAA